MFLRSQAQVLGGLRVFDAQLSAVTPPQVLISKRPAMMHFSALGRGERGAKGPSNAPKQIASNFVPTPSLRVILRCDSPTGFAKAMVQSGKANRGAEAPAPRGRLAQAVQSTQPCAPPGINVPSILQIRRAHASSALALAIADKRAIAVSACARLSDRPAAILCPPPLINNLRRHFGSRRPDQCR